MKIIDLKAKSFTFDLKNNHIIYKTDTTSDPGIVILTDNTGSYDMFLCNQYHDGGEVILKFKPLKIPSKKYEVGDLLGKLIILNG